MLTYLAAGLETDALARRTDASRTGRDATRNIVVESGRRRAGQRGIQVQLRVFYTSRVGFAEGVVEEEGTLA